MHHVDLLLAILAARKLQLFDPLFELVLCIVRCTKHVNIHSLRSSRNRGICVSASTDCLEVVLDFGSVTPLKEACEVLLTNVFVHFLWKAAVQVPILSLEPDSLQGRAVREKL